MYENCYAKFSQNKKLRKILLSTMNKTLVEASPRDSIWGIGYNAKTAFKVGYKSTRSSIDGSANATFH